AVFVHEILILSLVFFVSFRRFCVCSSFRSSVFSRSFSSLSCSKRFFFFFLQGLSTGCVFSSLCLKSFLTGISFFLRKLIHFASDRGIFAGFPVFKTLVGFLLGHRAFQHTDLKVFSQQYASVRKHRFYGVGRLCTVQ